MCGIGGIWVKQWTGEEQAQLRSINSGLKHRGPDDEGYLLARNESFCHLGAEDSVASLQLKHISEEKENFQWAFTHRRLSIIDVSPASHQPMEIDSYQIVFNGAIYNYRELRKDLEAKGHQFKSQGDTEVLLRAYIEWGPSVLDRLNGMWAFVIYDPTIKSWFGARDITGVKPLYYSEGVSNFAFASEAKILASLNAKPSMNQLQVIDFLVRGNQEAGQESMFKGVRELKPAWAFTFDGKQFQSYCYYQSEELLHETASASTESIAQVLKDAVKCHSLADVKLGACLSGGIDSSAITGILASDPDIDDFEVYSSVFPGTEYDESSFAKAVVDQWKLDWNRVEPQQNSFVEQLEKLHELQEFPLISSSTFAQYEVMRIAHEKGVKVMLDGQGADELFGGYPQYQFAYYNELRKKRVFSLPGAIARHQQSLFSYLRNNLRMRMLADPASNKRILLRAYPELRMIQEDLLHAYFEAFEKPKSDSFFSDANAYLASDFFGENLKNLLRYEDRNSMHFGIEARTPFADDRKLFETVFRLSSDLKLGPFPMKSVLRNVAKQYLPKKVLERRDKMGFVSPHNEWVRSGSDRLKEYFKDSSQLFRQDISRSELNSLFPESASEENYRSFRYLSVRIWEQVFFSGFHRITINAV